MVYARQAACSLTLAVCGAISLESRGVLWSPWYDTKARLMYLHFAIINVEFALLELVAVLQFLLRYPSQAMTYALIDFVGCS